MLKILSRIPIRYVYKITKPPPEQYSTSKIKIKEIGEEIKPLSEYKNAIIVFDDILGTSNSKYIDHIFIGGRHNNLDIYYLSEFYFDLPKRTIRNNSSKIILFYQTINDIENINKDDGGYEMSYDEIKEFCRKCWEDEDNYLYIDRSKKKDQGRYCIYIESKNTYTESSPETNPF